MWGVGNSGYSWSSTVSGTSARYLGFYSTYLSPSNANNRGYGFQLRCLQAFIGRPVFLICSPGCFAPGFRDAGDNGLFGGLGGVGCDGYSWSSAVSGATALRLGFHSTWLDPSHAHYRALGLQLRCLQAFIGRPVFLICSSGWFAPGYRGNGEGAMLVVGASGYSWISSVSGIFGAHFGFGVGTLHPSTVTGRAYGLPVRCLPAFIGILFLSFKSIL